MSTSTPNQQFRSQYHNYWGVFTAHDGLPNRPNNILVTTQFAILEEGDVAYVNGDLVLADKGFWVCDDPGTTGGGDRVGAPPTGMSYGYSMVMNSPTEIVVFPLASMARTSKSYKVPVKRYSGGTVSLVTLPGTLIRPLRAFP